MISLAQRFATLHERGEKALVLFFTAGDQPLSDLPAIVDALVEGGADAIEVGVPFSDPFGEGPTIQASSQRSLDNGSTVTSILSAIAKATSPVPLVTMGYYNPLMHFGLDRFASVSSEAGVTGSIVSDLVPDEADEWCAACAAHGQETIFLVAPTSTDQRIKDVAARTTGFVYIVSRTGVTGAENSMPLDIRTLVEKVRSLTAKPACVGFGISTPEHVQLVCQVADGAVVGSALVSFLHEHWDGGRGREKLVQFVRELKAATR